ncbi:UDP-2,4-diacetamido-2,4,6-trideoxy-beta-L-altropyranose hydrolase [Geothermobacter ehrlichii]|uniref:UDP-2,4-diacetamido-2,4, 6-trideoxy-beta-L-altropyranose hydrolase n=2 Tax=Geothermobacter ehrlichii TaxID=213224 RepID=A0A5D3WM50_9BACT|nr:UDP-2,4-diacetamido-2,4,6-trideoxy-beta-L-altropyranose hydrolase [Geothermobacter ehrlichii]
MRCLALANELKNRGADVTFIARDLRGNSNWIVEEFGFPLWQLPAHVEENQVGELDEDYSSWLGVSKGTDALETVQLLKNAAYLDWLIVDHYALDRSWEEEVRPYVRKIMVIDDLANRAHDCDLLLDQNVLRDNTGRYTGLVPQDCQILLGPKYALLRQEFSEARKKLGPRSGNVKRVLVFFGGIDSSNQTLRALQALERMGCPDIAVDVVVGAKNPNRKSIESFCSKNTNINIYCQTKEMPKLISEADLAICAGGTTTWERCCLGLPGLVISVAENQEAIAKGLAARGCQLYLGPESEVSVEAIQYALETLRRSPETLESFSRESMQLTDGLGVKRIVQLMAQPDLMLRRATMNDCESIYRWRNDEETRRHIFDSTVIPFEDHQRWFENSLKNPDQVLLVAEATSGPVGVLRYDLKGESATISVYLVPGGQPPGTGPQLIRSGSEWLRQNYPQVLRIFAEILPENIASQKAFKKAGYIKNHLTYVQELNHA